MVEIDFSVSNGFEHLAIFFLNLRNARVSERPTALHSCVAEGCFGFRSDRSDHFGLGNNMLTAGILQQCCFMLFPFLQELSQNKPKSRPQGINAKDLHDSRSLNWCQANSPWSCQQWKLRHYLSLWDLFTCDEMILGLATGSHVNHRSDFFLQPILVSSLDPQNELAYHHSWPPRLDPHKGKSFSHVSCMPQALLLELRGIETNPLLTTFDAFSEELSMWFGQKQFPCLYPPYKLRTTVVNRHKFFLLYMY